MVLLLEYIIQYQYILCPPKHRELVKD